MIGMPNFYMVHHDSWVSSNACMFLAFQVKDKSPAEMQITAEQLLREAKERELEIVPPPPKQKIADPEELQVSHVDKWSVYISKPCGQVICVH